MGNYMSHNTSTTTRPLLGLVEWFRPGEQARVGQVLADLRELGVTELRTGVSWADYCTAEGKAWYRWLLQTLAAQVRVLPCVAATPPALGVRPKTSAPLQHPQAFASFLEEFISDLGAHFEWVELWNQPDNRTDYDYTLDYGWVKFAEMVGGAAQLARLRGKQTVLGATSATDLTCLRTLAERGVLLHFDAVSIYGFAESFDRDWEGWAAAIDAARHVLGEHNSAAQLWLTAGFSTWQHDEFRQWQEFEKVLQTNAERVYWHNVQDRAAALPPLGDARVDERTNCFGLKRADGTAKLLYRLWATYGLDGLADLSFIRRDLDPAAGHYTLITGGAGFVGTNLAKRLLSEGKRVLVFDNLSRPGVERNLRWLHEHYGDRLQVYVGDIRDLATVRQVVAQAEAVFHFAAQVAVTTSLDYPLHDFEVNARGIVNVLEAIRAQPTPPPLVFTSTNKVYGGLEDLQFVLDGSRYRPTDPHINAHGISEQRPLDFHSPYGCSKGTADQYVIDYARSYGLPTVVFRMSCIYGPHQYGNEDQGWVAHFAIRAIEDEPISIYGDGKQVRDILFVEDLVDAFQLALKHMPRLQGRAFNIGGGVQNTVSLLELLDTIGQYKGAEVPLTFGSWRVGDQHYYVSDITKFSQATRWTPKHSVRQGVAKLYGWLCESRGLDAPAFTAEKPIEAAPKPPKSVKKIAAVKV